MSMHFAPQWVKPIKPSGTAVTPTAETTPTTAAAQKQSSVPFPALSNNGAPNALPSSGPGGGTASQPLSYSRATHAPQSPAQASEGSYFPHSDFNGAGDAQPHPFRYSRDQILALWDEEKVKQTPVELTDILGSGGVLTASSLVRPVGLRDLTEVEKKLFSTSIHPPNPVRRQPVGPLPSDPAIANGPAPRRTLASTAPGKDATIPGRGAGFGGFGRGEGGAFGTGKIGTIGGGLISPTMPNAPDSSRMPGSIGGGFGGVGRRGVRRTESGDAGSTWRAGRNQPGSFEGVLGFGAAGSAQPLQPQPQQPQAVTAPTPAPAPGPAQAPTDSPVASSPWNEKAEPKEKEGEVYGSGGGPGWGTGQKKWRIAAGRHAPESETRTINVPYAPERSDSVIATASGTPVPERDAALDTPLSSNTPIATPQPVAPQAPLQDKEDLGAVEWYYRDPNAQEQGPFTGSQMHEWYSHSYFTDDLPLRRSSEKSFHSLAELKVLTGNAVQPFLSPVRPRLPPNLPIGQPGVNGVSDSLRHMGISSPSNIPQQSAPFNQYIPNRSPFGPAPNQFGPHGGFPQQIPSPGGPFIQSPGQWGAPGPRINSFSSVGMSPIGQPTFPTYGQQPQHALYSPTVASLQRDNRDLFSPSVGVGAQPHPASPWGVPGTQPQAPYGQQVGPSPQHWQHEGQATQPPYQQQQPEQVQLTQQSYFPPTEEIAQAEATASTHAPIVEPTPEPEATVERAAPEPAAENAVTPVASAPEPKAVKTPAKEVEEAVVEAKAEPKQPPPSVWGKKTPGSATPSRKSSVSTPAAAITAIQTAPAPTSSKLPPAPASLPAKPVTTTPAAITTTSTSAEAADKAAVVATPEKPVISSRPAPWAEKEGRSTPTGPSLREIQEAEAREAEARKAARVAASSPAPAASSSDDVPTSMTWGLPTSSKSTVSTPAAVSTPSGPAWGSGESGPKKTLKQIQEEEEKRKSKAAQVAQASRVAASPSGPTPSGAKRGYADLAATQQPTSGAGWTTVGKSAPAPAAPRPASVPAKPVLGPVVKPLTTPAAVKAKPEETGPSVEFIRWCHQTLTDLSVNVDEMIQLLLTFPINASEAERQTIAEMVYETSSTLDGRRFAQEFFTKRKADAGRALSGSAAGGVVRATSLADVVKSVPKKSEDAGFRVVKAKGKKKN